MSEDPGRLSRRTVLRSVPLAAGVGLAGCGGDGDGGNTTTAAPTTDATTTRTPTRTADRPNIERATILRDEAAIVHVRQTITGEITWPETEVFNRIDPDLLGVWQSGDNRLQFEDDGTFAEETPEGNATGVYAAYENFVSLQYDDDSQITLEYQVSTASGEVVLDFWNQAGDNVQYTRTRAGSDDRDVTDVFQDIVVVEAENPETMGGDIETGSAGSGFVVTPEGHIVTNAHVVGTHQDPEQRLYSRLAVASRQGARDALDEEWDLTESERHDVEEIIVDKLFDYYAEHSTVSDVASEVGVLYGRAGPDEEFEVNSWPATIETAGTVRETVGGEPSWGRDVAILKVDEQQPLPTVRLGDATDLGTGEEVFVVGYPALGLDELFEERSATLEPSLTTGVVSSRKTLNSGVEVIETDAGINSGNSGGPIYNSDGEVVGIATFKPADLDLEQIAFGLPIEVATGFLGELGVENRPGELTTAVEAALEDLWRGDCEGVSEHVATVQDLWPDHPYADELVADCEDRNA